MKIKFFHDLRAGGYIGSADGQHLLFVSDSDVDQKCNGSISMAFRVLSRPFANVGCDRYRADRLKAVLA